MRPTEQQNMAVNGTHGRLKRRKKSFYEMKKAAYANLICYRLDRIGESRNPYFARASHSAKQLFLKETMNVSSPCKTEF